MPDGIYTMFQYSLRRPSSHPKSPPAPVFISVSWVNDPPISKDVYVEIGWDQSESSMTYFWTGTDDKVDLHRLHVINIESWDVDGSFKDDALFHTVNMLITFINNNNL